MKELVTVLLSLISVVFSVKANLNRTGPSYFITDAKKVVEGQFPFQVFVQTQLGSCGGVLISTEHVLTAGHCILARIRGIVRRSINTRQILGVIDLYSSSIVTRFSSKITLHERFSEKPGSDNDIALIRLDRPVSIDSLVTPAELTYNNYPEGTTAKISGWGSTLTENGGATSSTDLMFAEVIIISNEKCQKIYDEIAEKYGFPKKIIGKNRICTESVGMGGGPCSGDSGGPLSIGNDVVGLMESVIAGSNYNRLYCLKQYPAVYTKVSYFKDWIENAKIDI